MKGCLLWGLLGVDVGCSLSTGKGLSRLSPVCTKVVDTKMDHDLSLDQQEGQVTLGRSALQRWKQSYMNRNDRSVTSKGHGYRQGKTPPNAPPKYLYSGCAMAS
jgi:hypothetical protein